MHRPAGPARAKRLHLNIRQRRHRVVAGRWIARAPTAAALLLCLPRFVPVAVAQVPDSAAAQVPDSAAAQVPDSAPAQAVDSAVAPPSDSVSARAPLARDDGAPQAPEIAEVPEVRVRVQITGVDGELEKNIEAFASIAAAARSGPRSEMYVLRLYERAPEQIRQALEPFGFYRVTVDAELDTSGSTWTARYAVDPGRPLLIGIVDLEIRGEGAQDSAFRALERDFPLAPGDTLRHADYTAAKSSIASLAAERGYLDAVWDSSVVLVDLDAYTSDVVLHLTTGPRYRLGEVTFEQDVVTDYVLQPHVDFQPGDEYQASKLRDLQTVLSGTNYFSSVEIVPRPDLAGEYRVVPIEVHAAARKTQRYEIGGGASTDTGARVRLTGEWRRLNRHGHFASGDLRIAQRDQSLTARYNIPVGLPKPALWVGSARYGRTVWTTSTTNQALAALSYAHLRGKLREVLSFGWQNDHFTVGPDTGVSNLTTPVGSWTWTDTDNPLFASRGFSAVLEVRGAVHGVGSSASLIRGTLDLKWLRSLSEKLRSTLRGSVGALGTNDFRGLPPNIRFFAGGDLSIRGYAYQSLGPKDPQGEVIGGNSLLVGSAELEYRILRKWAAAAFVDAGNALDDFRGDVAVGAGVGAHWLSPVGMIRVDVAWGFQDDEARVHLIIGPDF